MSVYNIIRNREARKTILKMADYKLTLAVVVAVLYSVCIQSSSAISCYSCSSSSDGKDTNKCGAAPVNKTDIGTFEPLNSTVSDCAYCITTVTGHDKFSRGCTALTTHKIGCEAGVCYCNTPNCNDNPVQYSRGSLECYQCNSIDFMDNGCGAKVDTNSVYVSKVSGCRACSKAVSLSPDGGGGRYSRDCFYGEQSDSSCAATAGCTFMCESNLCNTAATTTTTTHYPILLAVICAIYRVYLL